MSENKEHIKIYDKYIYSSQEKINTIIIIVFVFVLGFCAGYFAHNSNKKDNQISTNSTNIVNEI